MCACCLPHSQPTENMQDLPECSGGRQRAVAPERVPGKDGGIRLSLGRIHQSVWSGVGVGTCLHTIPKAKAIATQSVNLPLIMLTLPQILEPHTQEPWVECTLFWICL